MSHCDKFLDDFSEYIDGELAVDRRRTVEAHIKECPSCKQVLNRVRLIRDRLNNLPHVATSVQFTERLHSRLGYAESPGIGVSPLRFLDWKIPALGASMAAIIFVGIMMFSAPDAQLQLQNSQPQESSLGNPLSTPADKRFNQNTYRESITSESNKAGQSMPESLRTKSGDPVDRDKVHLIKKKK